ncbi:MAG: rhodanese-like domain-containing protein [Desulfobacca sp.]|nr:rhodanese-like domain-containing protein [Desulfobacca sp.]
MTLLRRLLAQDLAWGIFILALALGLGLQSHWALVRSGFKGELASRLDEWREQYRQAEFGEIKTVNLEQAYALHRQGQALFIDARPRSEFQELHIAGAINLTTEALQGYGVQHLSGMDRQRQIVVYCGQQNCDASLEVAELLQAQGFSQVMAFTGGFRAWDEAGYPVDIAP